MNRFLVLLFPALCAACLPALGREIYVSVEGSDSNGGTLVSPYRTIQYGINHSAAGDTIYVRALTSGNAQAVYVERISFSNKSGSSGSPITLRNYPADVIGGSAAFPAVDQTGVTPPNNLTGLLTISNSSYVTVQGLEFRNYTTSSQSVVPAGIYLTGSGTGVKLLGNKVHHIYQSNTVLNSANANGFGIIVYGTSSPAGIDQLVLDGNEVYDLRTGQSESFSLNGNVTNFQVTNNVVHDCNNIGIDFIGYEGTAAAGYDYARNGVVTGNLVYNIDTQYNPSYGGSFSGVADKNTRDNARGAAGLYVDGGSSIVMERNEVHHCNYGIEIASEHSGKYATNCMVRDNLIRSNHIGGITMGGASAGKGGVQNCSVTNNTLYQNDTEDWGGGSLEVQHHVTTTTITQNVFVCGPVNSQFVQIDSSDDTFNSNTIDYNLYSGTSSGNAEFKWLGSTKGTYSSWQSASSQDQHSQFVSSTTGLFTKSSPAVAADFALGSASAAKDKGNAGFTAANGETDFFGFPRVTSVKVDIGMAEYGGTLAQIRVEQPADTALSSGSSVSFGTQVVPGSVVKTFVIKNTGTASLTGLNITIDGTNASEYQAGALSAGPPVAAGDSATFDVTFTPLTEGTRTATLHIASNDLTKPVFNVVLTGIAQLPPKITTQPLAKTVNPGASVTFTVVATGTKTLSYQWRKGMQNIPGATAASYTIPKAAEADEGGYDVIVTNPASTTTSDSVQLTVNDPVSIPLLAAQSAAVGDQVTFTVTPGGTGPFTYQWRKNGVSIAHETGDSYVIPTVSMASSASYSVLVTNIVGGIPSNSAVLSVVDGTQKTYTLPTTGKAVMPALFAGTFSSYAWTKDGSPLTADTRYSGTATKTLSISGLRNLPADDSGTYRCTGISPGGNLTATAVLIVYSLPPSVPKIPNPLPMPTGIVGGVYPGFNIPFDPSPSMTPTSFNASVLPAGLSINKATGAITGRPVPALTLDHTYTLTLTATNAKASSTVTASLLVKALPYGAVGSFSGPVIREPVLNNNLGGRVDITVSTTGSYTAKATLGAVLYSFSGVLATDVNGAVLPHGVSILKRTTAPLQLTLTFDVDYANHAVINGHVTDGVVDDTFQGWRNKWSSSTPSAELAAVKAQAGYYTFGMHIPDNEKGVESIPQGAGYGSFTIATTGGLTAAGRLADGTSFSCATFGGPNGEVLLYQAVYSSKGSVLGTLQIALGTSPLYTDNTLTGSPDWLRPKMTTGHTYNNGIGPMTLTVSGGRYVVPKAPDIVMGLADHGTANNASLVFSEGGITDTKTAPGIGVRVNSSGTVTRQPTNPCLTTLTISPTYGTFSGSFRLLDPNLINPAAADVSRTASYYGMMVKGATGWDSSGYFMLPKRPQTAPQTTATTDVLGGMVQLLPK